MFSVELLLDPHLEQAMRDEWARLLAADLPSAGRSEAPSNCPHVTVAVRDRLDASAFAGIAGLLPLRIELGGILLFGRRAFVLARQVVVTEAMLEFHRRAAAVAGPPEPRYANTGPDRWSPHVTLARRLSDRQVGTALSVLSGSSLVGEASGLRVWDAVTRTVTTLR